MIPLPGDSSVGYIWPTEDNEVESDDELDTHMSTLITSVYSSLVS